VLALYRFIDPKSITRRDLADIKSYLHHQARVWWASRPDLPAVCDGCSAPVARDSGWLIGSWLVCSACADRRFSGDALDRLKQNPDHFGPGLLELARQMAGRATT
jgi:hypothetical protein